MSDTQSQEPKGAIAKFLAASPDSVGKTIFRCRCRVPCCLDGRVAAAVSPAPGARSQRAEGQAGERSAGGGCL